MELILEPGDGPESLPPEGVFGKTFKVKKYSSTRSAGDAAWAVDAVEKLHVRTRGGAIVKVDFNGKVVAHTQRWDGDAIVALAMAKTGSGTIIEISLETGVVEREVPLSVNGIKTFLIASLRDGYITVGHHSHFAYSLDGAKIEDDKGLLSRHKDTRGLATIPGGEAAAVVFPDGIDVIAIEGAELEVVARLAGEAFGVTHQDGKLYVNSASGTSQPVWHTARLA